MKLDQFWKTFAPSNDTTNQADARRLRAIVVCNIFVMFVSIIVVSIGLIEPNLITSKFVAILALMGVSTGIGVFLFIFRHNNVGTALFFTALTGAIHIRPWMELPPDRVVASMAFTMVLQTAAAMIFSFRATVLIAIFNSILVSLPVLIFDKYRIDSTFTTVLFVHVEAVLLVLFSKISETERKIAAKHSAKEAIFEVASGVAHNLNSPLSAIRTALALLEEETANSNFSPSDIRSAVKLMSKSTQRALLISQGFQYYTQTPAQNRHVSTDLFEICESAKTWCQNSFGTERITFHLPSAPQPPILAFTKKDAAVHAFCNIFTAIIKNTNGNNTPHIILSARTSDNTVEIRINCKELNHSNLPPFLGELSESESHVDTTHFLELRMAKKLFENCGAMLTIESNMESYNFVVSFNKAIDGL